MLSRFRLVVLIVFGLLAGVGCQSNPVPLVAQAGSTIVLPIAGELDFTGPVAKTGFGGKWLGSTAGPPVFDDQRGELIVVFEDSSQSLVFEEQPLAVNRIHPSPTSQAALSNRVEFAVTFTFDVGQTIALVNAPCSAGLYDISLKRRIRVSDTLWDDTLSAPPYSGVIEVIGDCSGGSSPNDPPIAALLGDVRKDMKQTYPRPAAVLLFPPQPPGAGHLTVEYPSSKVTIVGVIEGFHTGRESVVQWDASSPPQLTIDFADPNADIPALQVVFEQNDPYQAGAADISEFTLDLANSRLYDVDGNLIHDDGSGGLLPGIVVPTQIR